MKPLSLDLRQRVAQALETGASQASLAQRFAVSRASVERIARKKRNQQSLLPKRSTGRKPRVAPEQQPAFEQLAASRSDWTLQTLAHAWQEQAGGKALSLATTWRTLGRSGFSFKKSAGSPPTRSRVSAKSATSTNAQSSAST